MSNGFQLFLEGRESLIIIDVTECMRWGLMQILSCFSAFFNYQEFVLDTKTASRNMGVYPIALYRKLWHTIE